MRSFILAIFLTACAPAVVPDPRVAMAHDDACAAVGWRVGEPICDLAPVVPQVGLGWPAISIWYGVPRFTYDRERMSMAADQYGYSAIVGAFGHEAGHLVNLQRDPVRELTGGLSVELDADKWGGCAMRILGYRVDPFQRLLRDLHPDDPDVGDLRAIAAEIGWQDCSDPSPIR